MKKLFSLLLILVACNAWLPTSAQANVLFSDSIRISLLTCGQGPDAYERFGHTAVRVRDLKRDDLDVVFHYGVFSFNTPNFVWRFVKGETDYQLGSTYTAAFVHEYSDRGLSMYEQQLDLDAVQAAEVLHRLIVNYEPRNRVYRYNYFFDNCATRPFHLIHQSCLGRIEYDTAWVAPLTYRQMVRNMTHSNTWLDFGITLAIGYGSDRVLGLEQQVFLPDYLAEAYSHATLDGHPLIVQADTLLTIRPEVRQVIDAAPSPLDPLPVLTLVLLVGALLLHYRIRQSKPDASHAKRARLLSNLFDTFFFLATGVAASILWMLLLGSEHPTVDQNLNCMWLWPTNLIFCLLIWIKVPQKVHRIYFLINFAALIAFIACVTDGIQDTAPAVMLLAATHLLRDIERAFFNE